MSKQIEIGNRVRTVKGTEGIVTEILEGGYLLENGKRVRTESISLVLPASPKPAGIQIGDRARFLGTYRERGIEYGAILTVVEDCDEWIKTRTAERKPISVLRSDLEVVEELPRLGFPKELKVGDRVRYVGQSHQHRGSFGKVISIEGDLHECDFSGMPAKKITRSELEVM